MTTTTPLSEAQVKEMSLRTMDLCLKVARCASGFMIDNLLSDADAAVMAAHTEAGAQVRIEIVLTGGLPAVRMLMQDSASKKEIELARIQPAVLQ